MSTLPPQSKLQLSDSARSVAATAVTSDTIELPVLPEIAVQLLKLTGDIECAPADIVALFKRDQSLTGHLLKITNSARYNAGQTVTSIQHAVARLGLLQVREVVMLISCESTIFNVQGFENDVRESFEISLAAAAFSQEIARIRRQNVEDAFLCGLLHDIGRPVLLQELSNARFATATDVCDDELRAVTEEFRIPMASRLVRAWELPERIAATIQHQAIPLEAGEQEGPAAMLTVAIDLARAALAGDLANQAYTHPLVDFLNLYPEDLTAVALQSERIVNWVKETA